MSEQVAVLVSSLEPSPEVPFSSREPSPEVPFSSREPSPEAPFSNLAVSEHLVFSSPAASEHLVFSRPVGSVGQALALRRRYPMKTGDYSKMSAARYLGTHPCLRNVKLCSGDDDRVLVL
jgi:hypothetical protein